MNVRRYAKLDYRLDRAEKTPEGFLQGMVPVTKCGVFPYRNQDGSWRYELRHPDDVHDPKSLDTLKMCPVQVEHNDMLDASNVDKFKTGHLGENYQVGPMPDGVVSIPIRIDGQKGLDAYKNGVLELSAGYELDLEEAPPGAVYDGKPYTHRQRNIRYNHVAQTVQARLGRQLRLDSADAVEVDSSSIPKEPSMLTRKINVDSVEYEVPAQVAVAMERLNARVDAAEKDKVKAEEAVAEKDKAMKANGDTLGGKIAGLEADLAKARKDHADLEKAIPQRAAAIAKDKADIMLVAQAVLPATELTKVAAMDSAEIKSAVIKAKYPDMNMDGKSADHVNGLFEGIKGSIKTTGTDALAQNRGDSGAGAGGAGGANNGGEQNGVVNLDSKRSAMVKRDQEAYKKPQLV